MVWPLMSRDKSAMHSIKLPSGVVVEVVLVELDLHLGERDEEHVLVLRRQEGRQHPVVSPLL